jgi:hypothetical protein
VRFACLLNFFCAIFGSAHSCLCVLFACRRSRSPSLLVPRHRPPPRRPRRASILPPRHGRSGAFCVSHVLVVMLCLAAFPPCHLVSRSCSHSSLSPFRCIFCFFLLFVCMNL